jgi:hypothetical protein
MLPACRRQGCWILDNGYWITDYACLPVRQGLRITDYKITTSPPHHLTNSPVHHFTSFHFPHHLPTIRHHILKLK